MIYLDSSEAFNKVDPGVLLHKLRDMIYLLDLVRLHQIGSQGIRVPT